MTVGELRRLLDRDDVSDASKIRVQLTAGNGALAELELDGLSVYHPGGFKPDEKMSERTHVLIETEQIPDWLDPDIPS